MLKTEKALKIVNSWVDCPKTKQTQRLSFACYGCPSFVGRHATAVLCKFEAEKGASGVTA